MPESSRDDFRCLIVIPARYASTRFPGKPLHRIAGRPLVQHVWERCKRSRAASGVVIATDDARIAEAGREFGAEVVMTDASHTSGTDRLAEVATGREDVTHWLNVQGDEPLISSALIDRLIGVLRDEASLPMITAASPMNDPAEIDDSNVVKVVISSGGGALYFSRSRIPFPRHQPALSCYRHLGIYGFTREFLLRFVQWPPSPLEKTEGLEQLRALENGAEIRVLVTHEVSPGVDTPAQAAEIERIILGQQPQ